MTERDLSWAAQVNYLEELVAKNALQACRYQTFLERIAYNPYSEIDSVALIRAIAKHGLEHSSVG